MRVTVALSLAFSCAVCSFSCKHGRVLEAVVIVVVFTFKTFSTVLLVFRVQLASLSLVDIFLYTLLPSLECLCMP